MSSDARRSRASYWNKSRPLLSDAHLSQCTSSWPRKVLLALRILASFSKLQAPWRLVGSGELLSVACSWGNPWRKTWYEVCSIGAKEAIGRNWHERHGHNPARHKVLRRAHSCSIYCKVLSLEAGDLLCIQVLSRADKFSLLWHLYTDDCNFWLCGKRTNYRCFQSLKVCNPSFFPLRFQMLL